MQSTNLPRLENNASNRQTAIGWFQVILGGFAMIGVPTLYLIEKLVRKLVDVSGPVSIFMWILFVVGCWFIGVGLNRLTVNNTFRRLFSRLQGGEFTIEKHAEMIGVSVSRLLTDLVKMHQRKYWSSMTVLDDAIVFTPIGSDPKGETNYKILASEGMRFITKNKGQKVPHLALAAFLSGLLMLLPLPFSNGLWFVVGIVISFPIQKISSAFTPKRPTIVYNKIPQFVPDKIELKLSGNEQADELIRQAEKHLVQLQDLEQIMTDPHLKQRIQELFTGTSQMVQRLRESPQKHRQVRQTLDYSLPTAINLFYKYQELEAQPVKGENITRSMNKIHEMSDLVADTFEKELNAMYQDQTLDIEVDIEVMEQMIQQEDLDFSPLASFRRGESKPSPADPQDSSTSNLVLPEDE